MTTHELPPGSPEPGVYRHYKGGLYTVLAVGRHSETEEWLVTYRAEAHGTIWVRPLDLWQAPVAKGTRFARLVR
ncbi:hypothetical protein AA103196_0418 [Ameyamaea chiangmaiensis NBRC 103196]|uniref:DUF1653 domain-containing protein n=1 Tax=Ameyamaea chiangmaiensis TaxID=442969 RepID=A0A850PG89_9PROT|nr:DUF1653 domain-containing protein [Ameyamaea chiangmaiensis]MBS4074815.1 DUF1653 domain-containing protein [Ameyamaea chiangmaiensis]NVN41649.1 DUF1653 domain-containing protein [Ameyamaea chiangmaiensis]GBQ62826.1 hypothetical protein AA103196_0418 [Ameyamaea chiangmaiensis NBRC 103196]